MKVYVKRRYYGCSKLYVKELYKKGRYYYCAKWKREEEGNGIGGAAEENIDVGYKKVVVGNGKTVDKTEVDYKAEAEDNEKEKYEDVDRSIWHVEKVKKKNYFDLKN